MPIWIFLTAFNLFFLITNLQHGSYAFASVSGVGFIVSVLMLARKMFEAKK